MLLKFSYLVCKVIICTKVWSHLKGFKIFSCKIEQHLLELTYSIFANDDRTQSVVYTYEMVIRSQIKKSFGRGKTHNFQENLKSLKINQSLSFLLRCDGIGLNVTISVN